MRLRIATRGSKLSLIQTNIIMDMIRRVEPDIDFELVIVKTTGDVIQDKPLYSIGVKGIFEKEVNMAVLRGEADIAVHSLKDLPSEISPGLVLAGFSPRDPPYDVLVVKDGQNADLTSLPSHARVGTSSVRRRAFLLSIRRDLNIDVIRGNVDTRIRKLLSGDYDAVILAEAGLVRLMSEVKDLPIKYSRLPLDLIPPAPGQGIVVAVARESDTGIIDLLRKASDSRARIEALSERAFLKTVGGGCHMPVGGVAMVNNDELTFIAGIASLDGGRKVVVKVNGSAQDPEGTGVRAARELLSRWSRT
ncbi:hydroxymethylbilane synthase [Vulcanisaeta thermophila]|uniref:hydroxymethylbilane synthase n=1 Tax=Vulcanisaeta thermophila TaxID=867917 RepID=UPI000853ECBA|nr:hydroxymethylbilane synthase [Vulcanisaeta thermophila]